MKFHKFEVYVIDCADMGARNIAEHILDDQTGRDYNVIVHTASAITTELDITEEELDDHELMRGKVPIEVYRKYFEKTNND